MHHASSPQVRLRSSDPDTVDRLAVSASEPDETLLRGTDFRKWFREAARRNRMPVTEQAAGEIFSLPMYPSLPDREQERIIACLRETLARI